MRPLTLKLKGFTSFRDQQELDFRDLGVFAITGPTGAGKSSLLDAITYALYGKVERVGDQCAQLVSKGMNHMAVELDFEVDGRAYRVTRRTPVRGPTKIILEKQVDGAWQSYGEGADRVRECEAMITHLLGLDYTGFTRSVLLPQGKFAEFMVGSRDDRRRLLSDLLGLDLFKRMAQRAGRVAAESDSVAGVKRDLLDRVYADVTPEALEAAHAAAREAEQRLARLDQAAKQVDALAEQWRQEQARSVELTECAAELKAWADRVTRAMVGFEQLASDLTARDAELAAAEAAVNAAQTAADAARHALETAESTWGSAMDLARMEASARRLPVVAQQVAAKQCELRQVEARRPAREATVAEQAAALATAEQSVEQAEAQLAQARQREEQLQHADMAATLASRVQLGDPCPVCGEPLTRLPEHPAAVEISAATRARKQAEKDLAAARDAVVTCTRQLDATRRDLQSDAETLARVSEDLRQLQSEHTTVAEQVAQALRGPLPADPAQALADRVAQLTTLADQATRVAAAVAMATDQRNTVTQSIALLHERLHVQRQAIEELAESLLARAHRLTETPVALPVAPAPDAPPAEVSTFAHRKVEAVTAAARGIEAACQQLATREAALLDQAHVAVAALVAPASTLSDLVQHVAATRLEAITSQATTRQHAETMAERLEQRDQLVAEVAQLRARAAVYQSLATDLRADRLIQFLQDEALETLAAAASRHLQGLSDNRYTLQVDRDFSVVDTWNGDEERSVRTLSGGETFLASLSLALALSEQVRSLSITERARLDSLFLDEGFGSLDLDSLRVVSDALEQLGGDGRLVGAITHVRELAEQFSRIEVEKSPRGSRLRVVA